MSYWVFNRRDIDNIHSSEVLIEKASFYIRVDSTNEHFKARYATKKDISACFNFVTEKDKKLFELKKPLVLTQKVSSNIEWSLSWQHFIDESSITILRNRFGGRIYSYEEFYEDIVLLGAYEFF